MNENGLKKFQDLLRTLFQFDCADLDFGIYRILNYKRGQVEAFITERLPRIVDQAFAQYAAADLEATESEIARVTRQLEESGKALGQSPFDEKGNLKQDFAGGELGKQLRLLLEKKAKYGIAEELKTRVYNDLYTFFSRYYEDGDFISKRRYGRHETYAIPYNGEEVVLYWANRDQYYVKTGDRFKAYRFKVGDYTVAFELRNAAPEQNGNGGKKRYFVLAHEAPITWNAQEKALAIAFEYRALTEAEEKEHGRTEQQKPQDSLNEAAVRTILGLVADANLKAALAKPEGTNGASLLHKHLTRFTRRNTADFFVHKDLGGFLRRELDFFIKNEVLLLDELIGGGDENLRQLVLLARVERQVAEAIIDFLAQVEDFQKRLWEKRKFVLRTEYCLTLDRLPEELWDEVLANEAQIAEWRQLYALDELLEKQGVFNTGLNKDFLKAHPTLVVDTRHFPEDFKWRLLSHFGDLDEALDGLLIKSENWQALNLLLEKYREKVKCIYIDPPYNSPSTEIIYKNNYKHSSWISLMFGRLQIAKCLLETYGTLAIAIDDHEYTNLKGVLLQTFSGELETVVVRSNPAGRSTPKGFSLQHEYVIFISKEYSNGKVVGRLEHSEKQVERYKEKDEIGQFEWVNFRKHGGLREESPKMYYPIFVNKRTRSWRIPEMEWNEASKEWIMHDHPNENEDIVLPTDERGQPRRWKWSVERLHSNADEVKVDEDRTGKLSLYIKSRIPQEGRTPPTWWDKREYSATDSGTRELKDLFGRFGIFDYPKAPVLVEDCLRVGVVGETDCVLDYFAGSGTTAHAVINLNRQDGGRRKYILVEMGDWFDTVILPRIKKVVFCEKWKDGKPQGGPGISHTLKYHYLEQYEDTLNNLELPREKEGQLAFERFGDEYLLKYMLEFETQGSPSLLNLDRFKDPFAYKLKVQEGDEIVERPVDLVETFNYLLGIVVRKVRAFQDKGRSYRAVLGEKNGKRVVIVWRSVVGLEDNEEALMQDKAFIEKTVLPALVGDGKPDRLLVNGACFVKDAEAIEPEFHRLMFAPVGT